MRRTFARSYRLIAEARLLGFADAAPAIPNPEAEKTDDSAKAEAADMATRLEGILNNIDGITDAETIISGLIEKLKDASVDNQQKALNSMRAEIGRAVTLDFQQLIEQAGNSPKAIGKVTTEVQNDFSAYGTILVSFNNSNPKTSTVSIDWHQTTAPGPEKTTITSRGDELGLKMDEALKEFEAAGKKVPPDGIGQFKAAIKGLGAAFQWIQGAFNGDNNKSPNAGAAGAPGEGGAGKPGAKPGEGGGAPAGRTEVAQMIKDAQAKNPGIKNADQLIADKNARLTNVKKQLDGTNPGPALDLKNLNNQKTAKITARDALPATDPQRDVLDAQVKAIEGQIKALEPVIEKLKTERDQLIADISKIKNAQIESKEEKIKLKGVVDTIKALASDARLWGRPNGADIKTVADSIQVTEGTDGVSMALKINPVAPNTVDDVRVILHKFGMDPAVIDGAGKVNDPQPLLEAARKLVERVQNPEREITEVQGLKIDKVANKIEGLDTITNANLGPAFIEIDASTSINGTLKSQMASEVQKRFAGGVTLENTVLLEHLLVKISKKNDAAAKGITAALAAEGMRGTFSISVGAAPASLKFNNPDKQKIQKFIQDAAFTYGNDAKKFLEGLAR